MIVKGEMDRPADLPGHAAAMHAVAVDMVALFPPGTGPDAVKDTKAKAEVWSKRQDFEAAAKRYLDESAKLVEVAKGGDAAAFATQFGAVGKSCGGCHDTFRVKD
jgi:cytochrome c556